MFVRILKDAHDEGIIDLRRRGNDFEVARAAAAAPVAEQLAQSELKATPPAPQPSSPSMTGPRLGMGPRGAGLRGRPSAPPPPGLFNIGVVDVAEPAAPVVVSAPASTNGGPPSEPAGRRPRGAGRGGAKAKAGGRETTGATAAAADTAGPAAKAKRGGAAGAKKAPRRGAARAKKGAAKTEG
jgi:hypothetical protein